MSRKSGVKFTAKELLWKGLVGCDLTLGDDLILGDVHTRTVSNSKTQTRQ